MLSFTMFRHPALSSLFPYTTLFRSVQPRLRDENADLLISHDVVSPGGASRNTERDRKSTRLNSSHLVISYAVFCLKKKMNLQLKELSLYALTNLLQT